MNAIKFNAHIDHNHRLEIQLPSDVPEGDAEVIVLIPAAVPSDALRRSHLESLFAQCANRGNPGRSAEDIDRQLAAERASWDE